MRAISGLALLLILVPAASAQAVPDERGVTPARPAERVWRVVDGQGTTRYADKPSLGAVRVEIAEPGRWGANLTKARPGTRPTMLSTRLAASVGDSSPKLAIVRPMPEETVWGPGGELDVRLLMDAEQAEGSRLVVELDGAEVVWQGAPPMVRLTEVWRGEHELRARLLDAQGNVRAVSEAVRFYRRQHSVVGRE